MLGVKILLFVVYLLAGVLFAWLAKASKEKKLKNNPFAGYRTKTIMTNDETWQAGHLAAWKWTALSAVLCFVVAVLIILSPGERLVWAVSFGSAILLLLLNAYGGEVAQRAAKNVLAEQLREK